MSVLCAVPIVCMTPGCVREGKLVNVVSGIPEDELDDFYEGLF